MKKILILTLALLLFQTAYTQHLFDEKFTNCITDTFKLESDSVTAKVADDEIMRIIANSMDEKSRTKISGDLLLQILVLEDGSSCLLSLGNKTNINTKKLNLKTALDEQLRWNPIDEKVAAIVSVIFVNQMIGIKRLGFNGFTGIHEIE
ncbi:MAG: hypothetical protein GY816_00870 [Cytophagales bacterium]|nr:hypothetical protein [Cytophagales bacterium]